MTPWSEKAIKITLAVMTVAVVAFIFIIPQIDLDPGVLPPQGVLFAALAMLLLTVNMAVQSSIVRVRLRAEAEAESTCELPCSPMLRC